MDCSLCNLNNIKQQKVFETKYECVIYNKWAETEGQCLIVPKRHVNNIRDLTENELYSFIKTVQNVSKILNSKLNPQGFNYGFNEKKVAGQHFSHFHFHIIPRYDDDNILNNLLPKPNNPRKLNKTELRLHVKTFKQLFEHLSSE